MNAAEVNNFDDFVKLVKSRGFTTKQMKTWGRNGLNRNVMDIIGEDRFHRFLLRYDREEFDASQTQGVAMAKDNAKDAKAPSIKELIDKLGKTTDQEEKKRIRRKLRALGHRGGLGKRGSTSKPSKSKSKPAEKPKKGKRAKVKNEAPPVADDEVEEDFPEDDDD